MLSKNKYEILRITGSNKRKHLYFLFFLNIKTVVLLGSRFVLISVLFSASKQTCTKRTNLKNEVHAILPPGTFHISEVLTDIFGKNSVSILSEISLDKAVD